MEGGLVAVVGGLRLAESGLKAVESGFGVDWVPLYDQTEVDVVHHLSPEHCLAYELSNQRYSISFIRGSLYIPNSPQSSAPEEPVHQGQ